MIKKIISLFITISLLFLLSSCDLISKQLETPEPKFIEGDGLVYWSPIEGADGYSVRFDYDEVGVDDGDGNKVVTMPTLAVFEENYISVASLGVGTHTIEVVAVSYGSFTFDSDWSIPLEFTINEDDKSVVNSFIGEKMSCNVTVHTAGYNLSGNFLPVKTKAVEYQGSGVIYQKDNHEYYLLTNYHVIYCESSIVEYTITDYYGRMYDAKYVGGLANYDLAVLKFSSPTDYSFVEFATLNPVGGSKVISLGQPKGQINAISLGKVLYYSTVNSGDVQIDFSALGHSAPVNSGSSGGALLDYTGKLVGVNFAIAKDGEMAFAIPIEKVIEFLDLIKE